MMKITLVLKNTWIISGRGLFTIWDSRTW